jgi:hypothetical protein
MGEPGQNDDQQRLSELQRQRADRRRHPDLACARVAVEAFRAVVPRELPILESEATNMPAMQSNELAKRAHARIVPRRSIGIVLNSRAHRFERSLPEQPIDKRGGRRLIRDEAVVSRQRRSESTEVGEICQAVA